MRIQRVLGLWAVSVLLGAATASAQNFNTDARAIAMGGGGVDNANIAISMVPKQEPYRTIVLPFGLIQVFGDISKFNPSKSTFDPVLLVEDLSSPLHYTFGRGQTATGQALISDLRNGQLNTNLATYQGFTMPSNLSVLGLADPAFGKTIKFARSKSGAFQGLYLGIGPYLGFQEGLITDPRLVDIFANGSKYPNQSLSLTNGATFQLGMDEVIGWRGRVPLKQGADKDTRDGVYYAYNYRIIQGFRLFQEGLDINFDLDANSQITVNPSTTPFTATNVQYTSGKGHASDFGVEIVKGYFSIGFGMNGIGNKIDWSKPSASSTAYTLQSLTNCANNNNGNSNSCFTSAPITGLPATLTIKLPVVKTGNLSFQKMGWGFMGSYTQGYNGRTFHGGVERAFGPLWLRGGGKYSHSPTGGYHWDPTYGFGFGARTAIDVGFYANHDNLAGKRDTVMAVSLRFSAKEKKPKGKTN